MAFFTFTTVSGSAATNNLKLAVTTAVDGDVSVKLVNGIVTYFNDNGNWTSTGYGLSAFAPGGIAAKGGTVLTDAVINYGGAAISGVVGTDLASFETPGFLTAANKAVGGVAYIDATGATSAQVDAFILNHVGAAASSLDNVSVNASQFYSLNAATLLAADGVIALNAANATSAQVAAIVAGGAVIDTAAVSNITVNPTQFGTMVTDGTLATAGATVSFASLSAAGDVTTAINAIAASASKVAAATSVGSGVAFTAANLEAAGFNTFATKVAAQGISATNATGFSGADWTKLIANKTIFAAGSITNADGVTVSTFTTIPNKFAIAGVNALSLLTATSSQIDAVAAAASKLAASSVTSATVTATQFSALASKVAAGQATCDATGASASEVTTILNYISKFSNSLSGLTIGAQQFNSFNDQGTALNAAILSTDTLVIDSSAAAAGVSMDASNYNKYIEVTGTQFGDSYQFGGTTNEDSVVAQGGKGADVIIGGAGNDSLSGGNAADTIDGGAGDDTITGGNSILANVLTGGAGDNTFITNGGVNTITDLATGDVIVNSAVVSSTVTTTAATTGFTATSSSSNSGNLTLVAAAAGAAIDLTALAGTVGATITGGAGDDTLTGSALADTITTAAGANTVYGGGGADSITGGTGADALHGGTGNDLIVGGSGADDIYGDSGSNVLTGGLGDDTFNIAALATDTITDLGGSDILAVAATGSVAATVTSTWTAAGTTSNAGTATLTLSNAVGVNLADAVGGVGYTITASGNANGSVIVASDYADTVTGSNGADTITGGLEADLLVGGAGADKFAQVIGDSVARTAETIGATIADGNTITFGSGVDVIDGFVSGTDKIDTVTASSVNYLNGATTATALTVHGNYYIRGDFNANTGVFTVNAATGHDSAVIADALAATADAAGQTGYVILTGVTSLAAADFI